MEEKQIREYPEIDSNNFVTLSDEHTESEIKNDESNNLGNLWKNKFQTLLLKK